MVTTLHLYQEGGIERLKQFHFAGQPSALHPHQASVEAEFRLHPPRSVAEAQATTKRLTGIQRSPTQIRAFLKRLGMQVHKVASISGRAHDPAEQQEQDTFQHDELEPRLDEVRAGKRTLFLSTPLTSSTELF